MGVHDAVHGKFRWSMICSMVMAGLLGILAGCSGGGGGGNDDENPPAAMIASTFFNHSAAFLNWLKVIFSYKVMVRVKYKMSYLCQTLSIAFTKRKLGI